MHFLLNVDRETRTRRRRLFCGSTFVGFRAGLLLIALLLSLTGQAQMLSTVAGTDYDGYNGDNLLATRTWLKLPHAVAVDTLGNLFIADTGNRRIRKVNSAGMITTVAGTGTDGYSGDGGPATQAALGEPVGVAVDHRGNLFLADARNHCVRRVTPAGIITTVAGTGTAGFGGDNDSASRAALNAPGALAVDRLGNLYIADNGNHRIRKVTPDGIITTAVGNGTAGLSGNDGPATQAAISGLYSLALDCQGSLYFVNSDRIRRVDTTGTVTAYAGSGLRGLESPFGIAVDCLGNLIFLSSRGYIFKVDPAGTVSEIGGADYYGFSGDDASIDIAAFRDPLGIALDNRGNIFIADSYNHRIRRMTPVAIAPAALVETVCSGQPIRLTATTAWGFVPTSYTWRSETYSENTKISQPGTWTATGATPTFVAPPVNEPTLFKLIVTGTDGQRSATAYVVAHVDAWPALTMRANPSGSTPASSTVSQNTPFVSVSISGCKGGTLNWSGSDGTAGSDTLINVPTSAIGTLVYSATCARGTCVSEPSTATVHVGPPVVTMPLDGYIYEADCEAFEGWAWDYNRVNTPLGIEILDGPAVIATLPAGEFRQDLADNGKGNGYHAFRFILPDELKNGLRHLLSARVAGSSFILKNSPQGLVCRNSSPAGNQPPSPPTVLPLTARLGVRFTTTLPEFTDPEGGPLTYAFSGLPPGLSDFSRNRVINGHPDRAGTFVVTYSATDSEGATNSVSFVMTVNPAPTTPVTGNFEGYVDQLDCKTLRGWAWNRDQPNTPVSVEIFFMDTNPVGEVIQASTAADVYRPDLKEAGKGNGAHAFGFTTTYVPENGLQARVLGSDYVLKKSPQFTQRPCPSERRSADPAGGFQVRLLGNPVNDGVQVEIRGAEGQSVRLQLTDTHGRVLGQHLVERAGPVERQTLPIGQAAPGLLLLQTTSGSNRATLKVLRH